MKFNPYIEVVLATFFWGMGGPFVKWLNLPPLLVSFFRMGIPTLVLYIFLKYVRKKGIKKPSKAMIAASIINGIRVFFFLYAFYQVSIANVIILAYTWPIFATVISAFYLKEKIGLKRILLLALSFLGIIFMYFNKEISFESKEFIGMLSVIFSMAMYAVTVILFKKEISKYSKTETLFYQNVSGAFLYLPAIFIYPIPNTQQIGLGILYSLTLGIIAFGFFFSALKKISASKASIMSYLEIIFASAFSVIFFNEIITWNMIIGALCIVSSTLMIRKETGSIE